MREIWKGGGVRERGGKGRIKVFGRQRKKEEDCGGSKIEGWRWEGREIRREADSGR